MQLPALQARVYNPANFVQGQRAKLQDNRLSQLMDIRQTQATNAADDRQRATQSRQLAGQALGGDPAAQTQLGEIDPQAAMAIRRHMDGLGEADRKRTLQEGLLASRAFKFVKDPQSYADARKALGQFGRGMPDAYDPNWVAQQQREGDMLAAIYGKPEEQEKAFGGTGMEAQSYNAVLDLGPKIADGTATPREQQIYELAYNSAAKGKIVTTADGRQWEIPGADLRNFPAPAGGGASQSNATESTATPTNTPTNTPTGGARELGRETMNQDQGLAQGFANRMIDAENVISGLEGFGAAMSGVVSDALPNALNVLKSDDRQRLDQAKRNFINANLRKESGAAIGPAEFESADLQYFPQPGDGEAVLAQKRRNRQMAIESLKRSAGPGYRPTGLKAPDDAEGDIDLKSVSSQQLQNIIDETKKALGMTE